MPIDASFISVTRSEMFSVLWESDRIETQQDLIAIAYKSAMSVNGMCEFMDEYMENENNMLKSAASIVDEVRDVNDTFIYLLSRRLQEEDQ